MAAVVATVGACVGAAGAASSLHQPAGQYLGTWLQLASHQESVHVLFMHLSCFFTLNPARIAISVVAGSVLLLLPSAQVHGLGAGAGAVVANKWARFERSEGLVRTSISHKWPSNSNS